MAQLRPKFNKERKNSNLLEKAGVGYFKNNMERRGLQILWTRLQNNPPRADHQVPIRPPSLEFVAISRS